MSYKELSGLFLYQGALRQMMQKHGKGAKFLYFSSFKSSISLVFLLSRAESNLKCHIFKLNILYVYVFALYFSPSKKKKRETLTFVRIYRYTHNQWKRLRKLSTRFENKWQCFYESFFYKVLCKKNSNFHLVKMQNHCSRHNICKTRLSAKLTTVTSSTTTNVIIWVLQMGESESGQMVSEKVKLA